jgi:hypothetical protein
MFFYASRKDNDRCQQFQADFTESARDRINNEGNGDAGIKIGAERRRCEAARAAGRKPIRERKPEQGE